MREGMSLRDITVLEVKFWNLLGEFQEQHKCFFQAKLKIKS